MIIVGKLAKKINVKHLMNLRIPKISIRKISIFGVGELWNIYLLWVYKVFKVKGSKFMPESDRGAILYHQLLALENSAHGLENFGLIDKKFELFLKWYNFGQVYISLVRSAFGWQVVLYGFISVPNAENGLETFATIL